MPPKHSDGPKGASSGKLSYKEEGAPGMHHPHSAHPGLPPPSHIPHPRSIISGHPDSAHQSQPPQQQPPGQYASPHIPNHSLPPYGGPVTGPPGQQGEVPYYNPSFSSSQQHPSYTAAENIDPGAMATATMNRPYAPQPMYPSQSASPSNVHSPQHDHQNRPLYSQPQSMYGYNPYPVQQAAYGQHPVQAPGPMNTNFIPQQPGQPMQHASHQVPPPIQGSPGNRMQQQQQQQQQQMPKQPNSMTPNMPAANAAAMHNHSANNPANNSNAAPGPIPATTPLVVRQDQNGVQWIAFEYSRDRVKMEYTIRCDVESIDVNSLSPEFKTENCVYPRACCAKDQYKGNRLHYETECNTVGWALAQLNPSLRGKRGLIQRAVDSWRNSNSDPRLRSRRVRRMAKMNTRKGTNQVQHGAHVTPQAPPQGVPAHGMAPPGPRGPGMGMGSQLIHHHEQPGGPPGGTDDVAAGNEYNEGTHTHHHQAPNGNGSPNDLRQTHSFYPLPQIPASMVTSQIPSTDPISHVGAHAPHSAIATKQQVDEDEDNSALFGDLPEAKRRKFILVDDTQRGTRVRVRVMLDQVKMAEMPDSYRKANSVYPRSWFATEMQSPQPSPARGRWPDDVDDSEPSMTTARTLVSAPMPDGSELKTAVPRMSRGRRSKEVTLNDLGYRMSWSQSRVFAGRTLFLQRSLDAYRNKMKSTMVAAGQDQSTIAPHFETRVGKRRWLDRAKRSKGDNEQ